LWRLTVRWGTNSAKPYFGSLQLIPMWRIRMGFALTLCVQALMIWGLDLSLWGWAACYAAFGLMWSSLQYADHAFSPLDNIKGTWNLRVNGLVRLAYLNYHFHQCHHRDITIPWRFLPAAERPDDRSIAFKDMLYFMWSGPRLTPGAVIPERVLRRNNLTVCLFLTAIVCGFFWIVYGLGDHIHHMAQFRFDLSTGLDRAIPFFPQMAIFYLCISPILLAAPFVMRSPERLLPFGVALGAEFLIALAVYYMFPVDVPAVAYSKDGLGGALMQFAGLDQPRWNNFPSLHVALGRLGNVGVPRVPRSCGLFRRTCFGDVRGCLDIAVTPALARRRGRRHPASRSRNGLRLSCSASQLMAIKMNSGGGQERMMGACWPAVVA